MRVLLVSVQRDLDTPGLKALHGLLTRRGHQSRLLYLPDPHLLSGNGSDDLLRFVAESDPGLIGFSFMSVEYARAADVATRLKGAFPSIPIVSGGIHPTLAPETCLSFSDYACVGEGEETLIELANALEQKRDVTRISNLCYRTGDCIRRNPLRPRITDLDVYALAYHIPPDSYIGTGKRIAPLDTASFRRHARYAGRTYSTLATRGCPFSCSYCCNNRLASLYQTRGVRRRSVASLIQELIQVTTDHPWIEWINFQDDCFLGCSEAWIQDFCREYRRKVNRSFIARCIPIYVQPERIRMLKEAGLAWISLGLQSGSDRTCRDVYRRNSLHDEFLRAARVINEHKVAAFYDVIVDNPLETDDDRLETVRTFMNTPKPFYPQIFSLTLYPGTGLHERIGAERPAMKDEYLSKDYLAYQRTALNGLIRLSAFLDRRLMEMMVGLHQRRPGSLAFKAAFLLASMLTLLLVEPIAYWRVIRRAEHKSAWDTLRTLPSYCREGLKRYVYHLRSAVSELPKATRRAGQPDGPRTRRPETQPLVSMPAVKAAIPTSI
jgi:anaerobic magnesium-protoporphyrin IX monomethyl ester cyclase